LAWPKLSALWATWRPGNLTDKELACLARGKAIPQRGNLKRELRSYWDLGGKGSKKELPSLTFTYYMTLKLLTQYRDNPTKCYFSLVYWEATI
jgi:hypothetical protein